MDKVREYTRSPLKSTFQNWRTIILLFILTNLLTLLAVQPLVSGLKASLETTVLYQDLARGFDFTTLADVIRNNTTLMPSFFGNLGLVLIVSILWNVLSSAGIIGVLLHHNNQLSRFWSSGSIYFFRFFRLALYYLLVLSVLGFLGYKFFAKDGLNILQLENEDFLISRFYLVFFFFLALASILKYCIDSTKVYIQQKDHPLIHFDIQSGFRFLFTKEGSIGYGLTSLLLILTLFLTYLFLQGAISGVIATLIGQAVLLIRVTSRVLRNAILVKLIDERSR